MQPMALPLRFTVHYTVSINCKRSHNALRYYLRTTKFIASLIHHTFGPLVTMQQCILALKLQWQPWRWQHGPSVQKLQKVLEYEYKAPVSLFSTGREALLAVLQTLQLQPERSID